MTSKLCPNYASRCDKIGHSNCPIHRLCSGTTQWEPEQCQQCIIFRDNLATLSPNLHKQALDHLKDMLSRMRKYIGIDQNIGNQWHFHEKRNAFLGDYREPQQDSAPNSPSNARREQAQDDQCDDAIQDQLQQNQYVPVDYLAAAFRPMFQELSMQIAEAFRPTNATPGYSRSNTPTPSLAVQQPTTRPPIFRDLGHLWFYLTHEHKIEGHKLWLNNELVPFIRHPTKHEAVRTIEETEDDTPYMTAYQAFHTMLTNFGAQKVASDKLGPRGRSFRLHLEEKSGLSQAIQILHTCTPDALHNLHTGDRQKFYSSFTTAIFEAAASVHFISGWKFADESDYLKFAKDDVIDLSKEARNLKLHRFQLYVIPKLLNEEKITKRTFLSGISGLAMMDKNIAAATDPSQQSSLAATARHFLALLKDLACKWIEAKYEVRLMALQFTDAPAADDLILSDVWCSSLFAPSAVKAFVESDVTHKGTAVMLDMSKGLMQKMQKTNLQCPCSRKKFRARSRSPIRQPFRPQQGSSYDKGRTIANTQPQGASYSKNQTKSSSQNYSKPQQKGTGKSFPTKNTSKKPNTSGGSGGPRKQQS